MALGERRTGNCNPGIRDRPAFAIPERQRRSRRSLRCRYPREDNTFSVQIRAWCKISHRMGGEMVSLRDEEMGNHSISQKIRIVAPGFELEAG